MYSAIIESFEELETIDEEFQFQLKCFGINNLRQKVVRFTSDGASVNRGHNESVKSLLRENSPWLVFIWCIAHRLELALKDALNNIPDFRLVDEMLNLLLVP